MQRLTNQTTRTQGIATLLQNSIRVENSLTAKLERTRLEVRRAQENVQSSEGRFLDYETADILQRTLVSAERNLEELTITLAVMERKVR
jgi:hypothetical protein